jgi:phage gp46-like protein
MDFKVLVATPGIMTFTGNTDVSTDIYMSLSTPKESFFQNKSFGLEGIQKITQNNILILKENIASALKWMILAGSVTSFDIVVEQDLTDINRLDISVTATQANGFIVHYQQFYAVGGPSNV